MPLLGCVVPQVAEHFRYDVTYLTRHAGDDERLAAPEMGFRRADDAGSKAVVICAQLRFGTSPNDHVRAVEPHHGWVRKVSVRLIC